MKLAPSLLLFSSALLLLTGCASSVDTVDEPQKIQEIYSGRLSTLKTGMALAQFRGVFPEAYVGGQSGLTTAYELKNTQKYVLESDMDRRPVDSALGLYHPRPRKLTQVLWFYFYDDRLVQWGLPNDWPTAPDKILEVRVR